MASPDTGPDYGGMLGKSKMHSEVMDKFQTSSRIRKPKEAEWLVQREFYRGNQYASYSRTFGLQTRPPAEAPQRPRLVYNYSRVAVEILLAYLLKNDPMFSVVANHGDSESQSAATLGRQLMKYYWLYMNCPEKLERSGLWVQTAGCCFWEIGWNPLAGTKRSVISQQPMDMGLLSKAVSGIAGAIGMDSPPQMQDITELIPEGDPYVRIRTPFEVYPDYGSDNLDDCQWILTGTRRPVPELRQLYPNAKNITPDNVLSYTQVYQRQALASFGAGSMSMAPEKMNRALVVEYWQEPDDNNPEGVRIVASQNEILQAGPTPEGYAHKPFAMWADRIIPGEFWPDATMRDLISPQKELNKRMSQLVQIADNYKNHVMAVKGAMGNNGVTNLENELWEYSPGQKPDVVRPPDFPDGPIKLIQIVKESIENTSGATPTIQGQMKGDERSGRQVAYMGDYAMGRIGLLAGHVSRFLSKAGTLVLGVVAANVKEKRIAKIVGPNREAQVRQFEGSDLKDCTDVTCEVGSILGFSRVERFDRVMQLADKGALDKSQVLEALELEDFYNLNEPLIEDRNNALTEQEQWRNQQFQPPPPNTMEGVYHFDDHPMHLKTHNSFRKSASYRMLPPESQAIIDAHCTVHENYVNGIDPTQPQIPGQPPPGGMPPPPPGMPPPPHAGPPQGHPVGEPIPGRPGQSNPEQSAAIRESGSELKQGLPPVHAVPPPSQQGPAGP